MRSRIPSALAVLSLAGILAPGGQESARAATEPVFLRYPGDIAGPGALRDLLARPAPGDFASLPDLTVAFDGGAHDFPDGIRVERERVALRGARGGTTIRSGAAAALVVSGCRAVEIRDLAFEATDPAGTALLLEGLTGPGFQGFVRDVAVEGCSFAGAVGIRATVFAGGLSVRGSRFRVDRPGGVGVSWADGEGLFVSRCSFEARETARAAAAVVVLGASDPASEGERARRIVLSGNRVAGDFAVGFDLADAADVQATGNRIQFPAPLRASGEGRTGVVVRHAAASALPEGILLSRNRVREAHTAFWLSGVGQGTLLSNDARTCGSPAADTLFHDTGGGLRLTSPRCPDIDLLGNDFRGLRSPEGAPAVLQSPPGSAHSCFGPDDGNRFGGRPEP